LLGRPDAGVVVAAFAVFEPTAIRAGYEQTSGLVEPETLLAARLESTAVSLASVLGGADVTAVADALEQAIADADGTGRPLFSGLAGQPWPQDPIAKLWRACEQIREHRGDSHVAVCVAEGLGPVEMNILTELWVGFPLCTYSATRGWSPEELETTAEDLRQIGLIDGDQLSDEGRILRNDIEAATDELELPIVEALGTADDSIITRLDDWSRCCIEAKAFPPDPFKRAAG
jgi:hypothetical protein